MMIMNTDGTYDNDSDENDILQIMTYTMMDKIDKKKVRLYKYNY